MPRLQLVMEVLKKLEGAYAVLVKSTHYPGELVACKRGRWACGGGAGGGVKEEEAQDEEEMEVEHGEEEDELAAEKAWWRKCRGREDVAAWPGVWEWVGARLRRR